MDQRRRLSTGRACPKGSPTSCELPIRTLPCLVTDGSLPTLADDIPAAMNSATIGFCASCSARTQWTEQRRPMRSERFCSETSRLHDKEATLCAMCVLVSLLSHSFEVLSLQSSHNALQTYPLLRALILSQLQVDTKAEIVFARNPSNLSFLSREGVPAYTDHDEDLGSTKIYVLRCGERFRLRLKISYAEGCQLPIRGIESIALETSTGSLVPLRHQIEIDDRMQFAATVEVDPTIDILKEYFAICPFYGTVEERYRKATLQLKFLVEDDPASPLVKNCEIYFLIVRSGRKLRCYRLARAIQQRWSRLPKPAKQTIRMIYHGVSKAVECVLP